MKRFFKCLGLFLLCAGISGLIGCASDGDSTPKDKILTGIEITTLPTKTEYYVNQSLDTTGMVVTASYLNGTKENVTNFTTDGFDSSQFYEELTITVSYSEKYTDSTKGEYTVTKTASYSIAVYDVVSLTVLTQPEKSEYYIGEAIDTTGLSLYAVYGNGESAEVKEGYTSAFKDAENPGDNAIIYGYRGKTVSSDITMYYKYKITYVSQYGTVPAVKEKDKLKSWEYFTADDLPLITDSGNENIRNAGWYNGETKVTAKNSETGETGTKITGDMTLTAKWRELVYESSSADLKTNLNSNFQTGDTVKLTDCDFDTVKEALTETSYKGKDIQLILPDSVTELPVSAFTDCKKLKSIKLPDGVTKIGGSAFKGCSALETINLPAGLTEIGTSVFCNCDSLKTLDWPAAITTIPSYTFSYCINLTSFTIPSGVTLIDGMAFYCCTKLASITIPATVEQIGWSSFKDCTLLDGTTFIFEVKDNWKTYSSSNSKSKCLDFTKDKWWETFTVDGELYYR